MRKRIVRDGATLVDVVLDASQRRAVNLPAGGALLVLGEAGFGKTTVSVMRLAHLVKTAKKPLKAVMVVPTEALRQLVEKALVRLGADVPVMTFEAFARKQARRVFTDLPKRESVDASVGVIAMKRHPALCVALTQIAERSAGLIDDDLDAPHAHTSACVTRGDLQHLFGDRKLMHNVFEASNGQLRSRYVDEVLDHTRVQFEKRSEKSWSFVTDKRRLRAIDERSLDDGTPDEDANSVDTEDYAVMFALDALRAKTRGEKLSPPRTYDCVVIDEAQDFSPIELDLLGRSLKSNGTLVVSGDAEQQLDETVVFSGWPDVMKTLGRRQFDQVVLDISYRCPARVVELARQILGLKKETLSFDDMLKTCASEPDLQREVVSFCEQHSGARSKHSMAIIARSVESARAIAQWLAPKTSKPLNLVIDARAAFSKGINVTSVQQVRGLEFDHVLVPDGDAGCYGDDPLSRRTLYVAVTRAKKSVRLFALGNVSPLICRLFAH